MTGVKVEVSTARPAKNSIFVADSWIEPNPGLDGEWPIQSDFALHVAACFSIEAKHGPHRCAHFLQQCVQLRIVAQQQEKLIENGRIQIAFRQITFTCASDNRFGPVLRRSKLVERRVTLRIVKLRPEGKQLPCSISRWSGRQSRDGLSADRSVRRFRRQFAEEICLRRTDSAKRPQRCQLLRQRQSWLIQRFKKPRLKGL